jgi:hypothetical protein
MVRRAQSERQAMVVTVRTVGEPSRVARECLARAYAVVVPAGRRPRPAAGGAHRAGNTRAATDERREGVA